MNYHVGCSRQRSERVLFFFFNDTATTEIYTLSLHDALPIYCQAVFAEHNRAVRETIAADRLLAFDVKEGWGPLCAFLGVDRKSTRLNSSHANISYAVFCLKKKKNTETRPLPSIFIA